LLRFKAFYRTSQANAIAILSITIYGNISSVLILFRGSHAKESFLMESLADVGLVTVQRFKLLEEVKPLESVTSQIQEWPVNLFRAQFDRFELWAVNLGLFVMGHGSLDYRIRDSESMRESIYKMIQNLNRSLDEGKTLLTGHHQGNQLIFRMNMLSMRNDLTFI
jgi:hypothetical protein